MNTTNFRILAKDQWMDNNTWNTGLNNNDLILGPSGSGKTRSYVKPNIMQCNESLVITDTKGSLLSEVGPVLKNHGYRIINIDFTDVAGSYGYNPFDYIRYDKKTKKYNAQDIITISSCLIPVDSLKDPYWDYAARMYTESMIGYVLECLPKKEHTLEYVLKLFNEMSTGNFDKFFKELEMQDPDSFALSRYKMFRDIKTAEKMHESIRGIIAGKISVLNFDGAIKMYRSKNKIDFRELGREKTAVFLTVSDMDRSMDKLVNLFYTQALQVLCQSADKDYENHRLPVPVRFILDDFAANAYIPDFDKITSVIRSREIYVSIILQSISQLNDLYGHAKSMTIVNNCDNCLYLGGQDVETASYIGTKANKTTNTILNMPLGEAYLFTRGKEPQKVKKYDIRQHEKYFELPEAKMEEYRKKMAMCEMNQKEEKSKFNMLTTMK